MSNEDLFQKVKDLKLPIGEYALFGSAPLGARGLKDCRDIDIITMEDLWDKCKSQGMEVKETEDGRLYLLKDEIELWKTWGPGQWDIESLIKKAEVIDDLPFVKLERVVEWKKIRG